MADPNPFDAYDATGALKSSGAQAAPAAGAPAPAPNAFDAFDDKGNVALTAGQSYGLAEGGDMSGPGWDQFMGESATGKILSAFGQGAESEWGATGPETGLSPETVEAMRKAGIFNDYAAGHTSLYKTLNEAVMRPAAFLLHGGYRLGLSALAGEEAAASAANVPSVLQLGEYALAAAGPLGLESMGAAGALRMSLQTALNDARSLKVIGPGGEAAWQGTPESDLAAREALVPSGTPSRTEQVLTAPQAPSPATAPAMEEGGAISGATEPAPDIHAVARQITPDTFAQYDPLVERQGTFRRWLDELAQTRQQNAEAAAPHGEQIADLEQRLQTANPRMTKIYQNRLAPLVAEHDAFVADAVTRDTPDMAQVRQALLENDYQMRDLAPQVSAAYRQAQEQMPPPPEIAAPEIAQAAPTAAAPASPSAAEPVPAAGIPEAPGSRPAEATRVPVPDVAADVSQKLVAAGRPAEEADAAGAIVAAHYEARAARFGGALGTGPEMYAADAPDIVAAAGPGRAGAAGSTVLRDGRATINLFGHADASTFIHETGHQWLEELLGDAKSEKAPPDLVADGAAVRDWLGAEADARITTRQHEKFARGFERYLMEGIAPSRALAGVFAKFKNWLTTIYQTVARLRAPITDDIRSVFDRMLATAPERTTIAPERAVPNLVDEHEAAVAVTPPAEAGAVADRILADSEARAAAEAPEVQDELGRGADEARGGAAAGRGSDGNELAPEPVAGAAGAPAGSGTVGAGGGEAAAPGAGIRAPEPAALEPPRPLLLRVPKEPARLVTFLQRGGGVRDPGGDVTQIVGGSKGRPGLINNRRGMNLDDAALEAWENGYFPELGTERPSVQNLLDAIEEDIKGHPRYSAHDDAKVREYQEAMRHNAEVDRIAHELEIDAADMTHAQFWDAVAERLSADDAARESLEMSEAAEASFAEADARAKEHMGDAWEPDTVYDEGEPRTLEDMERERQQRESPPDLQPGNVGAQQPAGPAGPDQRALQEGGGQGGRGAEPPGRAGTGGGAGGAGAAERPTDPDATLSADRSGLVDKAGNIRLDKLNTTADVDAVIRQMAGENNDFLAARRGVVSDQQVFDLASAMGLRPEDLDIARLRAEYSPERVQATRELFVQTANDAHRLSLVDNPTPADITGYMAARSRLRMVQEYLSALTAETGRGLRAFRATAGAMAEARSVAALMGDLSENRTLFQIRREMAAVSRLDTSAKVSGMLREADKPGLGAMLLETFRNWLIAGPVTHATYAIGNEVLALSNMLIETPFKAAVGTVQRALGVEGAEMAPRFGEIKALAYGHFFGQAAGLRAAYASVKVGQTMPLPGEIEAGLPGIEVTTPFTATRKAVPNFEVGGVPVPLGSIVRAPGERMVAPIHSYNRAVRYAEDIGVEAYRQAAGEGLEGDALAARVGYLRENPSLEMMQHARDYASRMTLMSRGGPWTRAFSHIFNLEVSIPGLGPTAPLGFVAPFVTVGSNIAREATLERGIGVGPIAALFPGRIRNDLLGRNGAAAQAETGGRLLAGTSLTAAGAGLAAMGIINRSAPSNPSEAAAWRRVHGMPHAINLGDFSYDLARLGVLGIGLGITADLQYAGSRVGVDDWNKVMSLVLRSYSQNFLDEGFMRSISNLMKAADDTDRYGGYYIKNLAATAVVPYSIGMAQAAHQIDPYMRDARTLMDQIKSGIPWWSETLEPRVDTWGQEIPNRGWLGLYRQHLANDPVDTETSRISVFPSPVKRTIVGVALTPQQYYEYGKLAGRLAHVSVEGAISSSYYPTLQDGAKHDLLEKLIRDARHSAATAIKIKYPSIWQAATEAKKAMLGGARPPAGGWPQEASSSVH